MKTKFLFGILVLFLGTISFVSCNDDEDKTEYHLKLSKNSCEVMQLRTTSIYLIAHENTTLDIASPELIDAVYKWGNHEGFTAIIEITGKQKGETSIVVTDNVTGESATIKVKVTEYPMPRLAVKQPGGNIFDIMSFYLRNDSSEPVFNELSSVCDSIVWSVKGQSGSYRVFDYKGHGSDLVMEWGHCFLFPGEYETYLTVWKDNNEIFCDQLDISVTDDKDFLAYDWKDITKTSQAWTAYVDVLGSNPGLMTSYSFNGPVPSVEVVLSSDRDQSYDILYSYFSKLYAEPAYEDHKEKQKMFQLYDELFSEQKKYPHDYPCAIWVTEHANIVLLIIDTLDVFKYVIYAEPVISHL
ncbi:hypothetical protein [Proteiniphilum acetatigenes]|uniref:hypothetical protein n=1 Tax=Proteiniphilum acetatigenes TaxID=294710 RepID=UPI00035CF8E5|nr:hypothetical protein [Proteiniphilum acetatigenes]SFK46944.1 hypothetical protein SAMN05216357_102284 [Porphyromonadaceae bacterium KH3CP3RA]